MFEESDGTGIMLKFNDTIDWKYILVVSVVLICFFMTVLGLLLESF